MPDISSNDPVELRIQLLEAREAVGFFSTFFAVVGFFAGATVVCLFQQHLLPWWFG